MRHPIQFTLRTMFLVLLYVLTVLGWVCDHTYMAATGEANRKTLRSVLTTCNDLNVKCQVLERSLPMAEEYRGLLAEVLQLHRATKRAIDAETESEYIGASSEGVYAIAHLKTGTTHPPFILATLSQAMRVPERYPGKDHFSIGDNASHAMSKYGTAGIPFIICHLYDENPEIRRRAVDCLWEMCDAQQPGHLSARDASTLYRPVNDAFNSEPNSDVKDCLRRLLLLLPSP